MLRFNLSGVRQKNSMPRSLFIPGTCLAKNACRSTGCRGLSACQPKLRCAICSMIFGGVFDRFPKLRVAFAHGGGAFPFTIGRVERAFHVRPDLVAVENNTNPRAYLARGTGARRGSTSIHSCTTPMRWTLLLKLFGTQRVALGSDYPFPLGEAKPGELIESMELSSEEKAQLLSGTAREFLGL